MQRLLSMGRPIFKALILPGAGTPSESCSCLGGFHLKAFTSQEGEPGFEESHQQWAKPLICISFLAAVELVGTKQAFCNLFKATRRSVC